MMLPDRLYVAGGHILPCEEPWEEIDKDPRGLLLMWEPAIPQAKYVMAMDSSEGITGWSRATRSDNDHKVDNGAIVVFRVDGIKAPKMRATPRGVEQDMDDRGQLLFYWRDVQVAEYAAPCDPVEIARVANVLGRIYAGDADDQCELIWESWPGCGILCTQELLRVGYGNLWMWEYLDSVAEETNRMGWRSTRESQKLLWQRARRHLIQKKALIRSKWLLEEYANAEIDMEKMRARAAYGYHDDRFQAANMAFWAAHKWTYEVERTQEPVLTAPMVDYQRYAPTLGSEYQSFADWRARACAELEEEE